MRATSKNMIRAAGLSLLMVPAAFATATAAERLVVQEPDLLVVVDREVGCGEITELTMRSSDRDLFRKDSPRMQRVVDGTRAILGFECARTPAFNITGEDNRTGEVVFRGTAGDPTQWLVRSSEALAAAPSGTGSTVGSGSTAAPTSNSVSLGSDAVGGVRTGMTVAEASNAAGGDFPGKPVYRRDLQALVAGDEDCVGRLQSNTRLIAGQRCLVGQTVESDPPRVYQTILHQAVDQDQRAQIVAQLEERFGRPAKRERGELPGSSSNNAGNKYTLLSWRAPLERPIEASARPNGIDPVSHELEALVVSYGQTTEVTLWSTDTALLASNPQIKAKF
ncbi:hypothetical protein [Thalassobaculum litoreum]|uniref:Uncharacterized protein n=1 Tax=Thalassobaculum litoreum DSM 18839 TaxID=1123362 RepID=A0A8G2EY61_9PROT|nr:hypothetical protein [Thalassobaculum litoreum]SDF50547.1 hypothetical protein SAMN05660686_01470 [Thalassobaculum litoreum DSM 18839]